MGYFKASYQSLIVNVLLSDTKQCPLKFQKYVGNIGKTKVRFFLKKFLASYGNNRDGYAIAQYLEAGTFMAGVYYQKALLFSRGRASEAVIK